MSRRLAGMLKGHAMLLGYIACMVTIELGLLIYLVVRAQ